MIINFLREFFGPIIKRLPEFLIVTLCSLLLFSLLLFFPDIFLAVLLGMVTGLLLAALFIYTAEAWARAQRNR